jgi:hypothetical protein
MLRLVVRHGVGTRIPENGHGVWWRRETCRDGWLSAVSGASLARISLIRDASEAKEHGILQQVPAFLR